MMAQILSWKVGFFNISHNVSSENNFASIKIACFSFKCCPSPVRRRSTSPFSGTSGTTPVTMNLAILRWAWESSALMLVSRICFQMLNSDKWFILFYFNFLQEMYEQTSDTRDESLEPKPFGQGEFIEHKHAPITCYNEIHPFPMLRVGFWPPTLPHGSALLNPDIGQ